MSKRILIVEDSPAMRQLLLLAIRRFPKIEVDEVGDGVAALRALAQADYDVVFLDLNMPVLDGMKLIKRMREDSRYAATKIVVVTTEENPDVQRQALELGADQYVRKPVNRRAIEQVLRALMAPDS
ncbi:MAG TPA: response regulator [Polyangia bacterium]|nr:response regulator [Polyangia bacterium]